MDFSVHIKTNAEGFRDRERQRDKPPGTVRIALLGDSLVEAIQVPLPKTAGQILETRLNTGTAGPRFEVLNFGVSNYGVGQYLLVWERYASQYSPEYVFALIAGFQMVRSTDKFVRGSLRGSVGRPLWIRPTFRLQNGSLIREPARDFDEFVTAQQHIIRTEFGGNRIRKRETSLLGHYLRHFWAVTPAATTIDRSNAPVSGRADLGTDTTDLNLRILQELGTQVRAAGAELVVVDLAAHFKGGGPLSRTLAQFCSENAFGYVALAGRLAMAKRQGIPTRWPHDGHLNEAGNEIFADAMHEWLKENAAGVAYSRAPRRQHDPARLPIRVPPVGSSTERGGASSFAGARRNRAIGGSPRQTTPKT
jgi:hypothetical protein